MRYIKMYEEFDTNIITQDDIIDCIKNNKLIYTKSILDLPEHESDKPVKPVDIDNNKDITLDIDGNYFYTKLNYVYKVEN